MTIYALFLEDSKCLMKDDYKKSFDVDFNEKGLLKMLSAIKVQDDIVIFIEDKKLYSKVRFSLDFKDYKIRKLPFFDENSKNKDFDWISKDDYIECSVKQEWQEILGDKIIICNDKSKQTKLINELNLYTFLVNDITTLRDNILKNNDINKYLKNKMLFEKNEVAQDIVELGDISSDLLKLYTGKKTYVCYSVKPELQDRIGKVVYLTKDKNIKEYIMKNSNDLAIEVGELKEFHNKVLKNDKSYIVKLMFDGSEVD